MNSTPVLVARKKNAPVAALGGMSAVVIAAAVVAALYFGREFLVPFALAGLLAFVLTPLVSWLEGMIGRVASVSCVAVVVFCALGALSWVLTRQALDLVNQLPNYRSNIEKKIHSVDLPKDGSVKRFSQMVAELESEIPSFGSAPPSSDVDLSKKSNPEQNHPAGANPSTSSPLNKLQLVVMPFMSVLGTCGIVVILVIFMLLKREDLRGRLIRLIGQGRISLTSRAMEDAADRVSRYLIAQLLVNAAFGAAVAIGLYFIGLPNAFLWGALSAVLRFIPYIGAWLAALCPIVLASAVSPDWTTVLLTLGLFMALELITANVLEPLLYRSSTGVSSLALIVAAIFWTWLWGPIGLLLSTPLTVCLAVIGTHVPKLTFFNILLGNEEALTPSEECYHRLLVGSLNEASQAVENYIEANSITALYDSVLIPTITLGETEFQREDIDESQRAKVIQGVHDIIGDLALRPISKSQIEADRTVADVAPTFPKSDCRVVCVSTRAERDETGGSMLIHLLKQQGFEAITTNAGLSVAQIAARAEEFDADALCISVIPPTTIVHVRQLCAQLRSKCPNLRIVVGLWGATENLEAAVKSLRASGADEVVVSLAEAVIQLVKLSAALAEGWSAPQTSENEEQRVAGLFGLEAYGAKSNPLFDGITKNLTRTFEMPIALITFIDRDLQHIKSQFGLPEEMAQVCTMPRKDSVCNHVISGNAVLVVEDLRHDRRFAKNEFLKKHNLRFYAGTPLRTKDGQAIGALCVLDTKPRKFGDGDRRLLKILGEELSEKLVSVASPAQKIDASATAA